MLPLKRRGAMSVYIFYACQAGGIHETLEVHTLSADDIAADWARKIMFQHPDAQYVTVKRDGVTVATEYQVVEKDVSAG
jgi:hypothetical protein